MNEPGRIGDAANSSHERATLRRVDDAPIDAFFPDSTISRYVSLPFKVRAGYKRADDIQTNSLALPLFSSPFPLSLFSPSFSPHPSLFLSVSLARARSRSLSILLSILLSPSVYLSLWRGSCVMTGPCQVHSRRVRVIYDPLFLRYI